MIAIHTLELTQPLKLPTDIQDSEAVRFYCTWEGQIVGHFTIWHKGQPIGENLFLEHFTEEMGLPLLNQLFGKRFGQDETQPWPELERLVRVELGLEAAEFPAFLPEVAATTDDEAALSKLFVSITIPSRDRPADLQRCLQSLTTHQSRFPFEIVVADNNPASGLTEPMVRNFPQVRYVPEPRPGVTFARNAAALHARGDIIVCTDDDATYAEGWLDHLIAPYADPQVTAVSGLVRPLELASPAQFWFEVYGGLTRNYQRTSYDRKFFDEPPNGMAMAPTWDIGVTANLSFRAEILADPQIGPFDDGLRIAEDPYILYRLIKADRLVVYEPKAVVYHRHRADMAGLARQLYNYGRSSTSMQLRTFFVDGDVRGVRCLPEIAKYDWDRIMERLPTRGRNPAWRLFFKIFPPKIRYQGPLRGRTDFPLSLVIAETKGHIVGPFSLLKSLFQVRTRLNHYTWEQFAQAQSIREEARATDPSTNKS